MKVAQVIAEKFITAIQTTKVLPWQKQFTGMGYCNAVSKRQYRGINILLASYFGADSEYLTFNQAKAAGGMVKKGSKGIPICFYTKTPEKPGKKSFFYMVYYTVFNLKDIEGGNIKRREMPNKNFAPIELAEKLALASGVPITHGADGASYIPARHEIKMPHAAQYNTTANYYKTLFHELTHAMGKACGVQFDTNFGSDSYAKEELVAELGANLFLTHCGIDAEGLFDNSQAYFQGWLKRLQGDHSLLISAASQAQKRFDALMALVNPAESADAEEGEEEAVVA